MATPLPIVLVVVLFGFFILPIALIPEDEDFSRNSTVAVVSASPVPANSKAQLFYEVTAPDHDTPELVAGITPPETVEAIVSNKPHVSPSLQLSKFDMDKGGLLTKNEFVEGCQLICSRLHCGEVDCNVRELHAFDVRHVSNWVCCTAAVVLRGRKSECGCG
jgi:hypothetical protein